MAMHDGKVEKVSAAEMKAHVEQRLAGITLPENLATVSGLGADAQVIEEPNPDYKAKIAYETERGKQGWTANCDCGWSGNNPYASEADAELGLQEHYAAVTRRMEGS
jgi:hypothetical protein